MALAEVSKPEQTVPSLPQVSTNHPIGFWFIFMGELAERASFYGMKAVLLLYLVHVFAYKREDASTMVHLYVAACYLTPLIGGLIADQLLNKYWTIVLFSIPYLIGQFLVGLSNEYLMFGALGLLAFGSGVIKPNISTLMGLTYEQQRPGQDQLRSQAFSWFYVAINIGSFGSTLACPFLRDYFGGYDETKDQFENVQRGYLAAFMFPAGLMTLALLLFALGRKFYAVEPLGIHRDRTPDPNEPSWSDKLVVVGQILGLFLLVMFFWAIFDQHTSTWTLFAKDYLNLNLDLVGYNVRIAPDQVQAVNPLLIVLFVPIVNLFFSQLAKAGLKVRPTDKMVAGFLLTALSMAIHAFAGYLAVGENGEVTKVTVWWQLLAYLAITIAEILISVTGLELAFTAAPKSMKGFITSLWLLMVFLANFFINAPVSRLYPNAEAEAVTSSLKFETPYGYFGFLTLLMLGVTAAFIVVAFFFNRSRTKRGST